MSIDLARESPLFDKQWLIQQCQGNSESRAVPLSFRIIPGTRATAASGQTERLIHFEIADENDPYFLYILDVGEQDFHLLKRDQSLLVEFAVFPSKLIELVELCLSSSSSSSSSGTSTATASSSSSVGGGGGGAASSNGEPIISSNNSSSSTFVAKLDTVTGVLSVVETNMFKQLTHISLQLRPGNDAAIKAYLASRLYLASSLNRRITKELQTALDSLSAEQSQRREMATELTELKTYREVEEQGLRSSHSKEMSQLQMSLMTAMEQARERFEAQIETARSTIDALQQEAKAKAEANEQQTIELKRENAHLEFRERELSRLLESAEADRDRISEECKQISTAKRATEDARSLVERDLARAGAKNEALLLQLQDRDEMIAKSAALLKATEESRAILEEKLEMYVSNGEALHEKLREGGAEITRGNAVIARLQQEGKQLREKSKLKGEVIRRQEALVLELRTKNGELDRLATVEKDAASALRQQIASLQRQVEEANERVAESTKIVANNKEVISYLNEEINKWQLGLRTGTEAGFANGGVFSAASSSSSYSPTARGGDHSADTTRDLLSPLRESYHNAHTSSSSLPKDVYIRGMQNLGLADGGLGLESFEYYASAEERSSIIDVTAVTTTSYRAPTSGSRGGAGAAAGGGGGAASSGARSYAWQAEDFGLEE